MSDYVPRLKDAKNAWCRERGHLYGEGMDGWAVAKRQFDRLIEQIRADAYARGRAEALSGRPTANGSGEYLARIHEAALDPDHIAASAKVAPSFTWATDGEDPTNR